MSEPHPFTGERFTPECVREIWYEHWHRYAFAANFAAGARVLDAACGEGYGAALLARRAASVLGVDISDAAIEHARKRYGGMPGLSLQTGDVTALDALSDSSFDLIVSFETLEHVAEQDRMLAGFARLLAPRGLLLVSSPDKRTYSDLAGFRNEHHVRELYRNELESLLARHFPACRLLGQKLMFRSAIWDLTAAPATVETVTARDGGVAIDPGLGLEPLYFIAVCAASADALPQGLEGRLALFGDAEESVYAHYNNEVRKNMQAGTLLAQMQAQLEAVRAELTPASAAPAGLLARLRRWFAR